MIITDLKSKCNNYNWKSNRMKLTPKPKTTTNQLLKTYKVENYIIITIITNINNIKQIISITEVMSANK